MSAAQTQNGQPPNPTVLRARDADGVLAVVPYHLGFHPTESLVLLALGPGSKRVVFGVRVDLPPEEHVPPVADQLWVALERNRCTRVLIVAYTRHPEQAQPLVDELLHRAEETGIEVLQALRADGERWFSYLCDSRCCPPEGTAYDISSHPLSAQAVLAGEVALPGREALEASVAPVGGDAAETMLQAAIRAEEELLARAGSGQSAAEIRAALEADMRALVRGYLEDPHRIDDDEAARAAVWAQFLPVRDVAWMMMGRADARVHLDLWSQVLRRVPPPYEPAVGCLTAFAAWLHGDGALAGCALERVLAVAPDYSMAGLIDQTLRAAIPPSSWDRLPTAM